MDALRPGQTGCLMRGSYRAPSTTGLRISTPRVTLRSAPGVRARLVGRVVFTPSARGAALVGLRLSGRNAKHDLSPLIYAHRVQLRDNVITNNQAGICVLINDFPGSSIPRRVVIAGNRIHDCGQVGTNQEHAIYLADARDTVIRDNLIYRNADRGIQLYPNADGTLVTGNVIDSNGEGIIFGGDESKSSDNNLVKGNVISNSRVRYNVESSWGSSVGTGNVVRNNCVWITEEAYAGLPGGSGIQNTQAGFIAQDNIVRNPRYVGRASGDYAVRSSCPVGGRSCARAVVGTRSGNVLTGTPAGDRLEGRGGGDRISGGRGRDCLEGGPGGDTLNAAGGGRDAVRCGGGRDTAIVDRGDRLSGCERVRRDGR